MPLAVKNTLFDIHALSLNFPDSVVDLRIATYDLEENQYKLCFLWEIDKIFRSTNAKYIAYDKQKDDFFNWLTISFREERYDSKQLLTYFQERFSESNFK